MQDNLGYNPVVLCEKFNLSPNTVDILCFHSFFIQTNIAIGMHFKCSQTGNIHKFTINVNLGYEYMNKNKRRFQLYVLEYKEFRSNVSFKYKTENGNVVPFNSQSTPFRL